MKALFFALSLIFMIPLYGQDDNPPYKRQFGFDAGYFISQFLNFAGSGDLDDEYQMSYRKFGEQKNLRLGLGLNFSAERLIDEKSTNITNALYFRIGNERFKDFGKPRSNNVQRWRAFYGWDAKLRALLSSIGGKETAQIFAGPAPFFGLLYRINDRISVSSELSYNMMLTWRESSGNTRIGATTFFSAPRTVYVNYDF